MSKEQLTNYSRKDMDALGEFAGVYGAKGLAWLKVDAEGLKGPIAKFFEGEAATSLIKTLEASERRLINICCRQKISCSRYIRSTSFKTWKRT